MGRLDDKIAIVTGAARGMGAATARLFAAEGAKVVLTDVLEAEGQETARSIGNAATFMRLDVRQEEEWRRVVGETVRLFGRVDVLVNNAAIIHFGALEDIRQADLERLFAINMIGPILGMGAVKPVMARQGRGSIVNISSVDGLRGCNGLTGYTGSKWGVRGLTKSAAMECGPLGIRVNSVHPGGINTVMGNPQGLSGDELNKDYKRVPLQRIGEPEEVARVSLFLASDEASYVAGAEIAADGGWSAGYYQPVLPGSPVAA